MSRSGASQSVFGFPITQLPTGVSAITIGSANQARYMRCLEGGTITKVGFHVGTASGNISVAVFRNTGVGRAATPGAVLASSGAVACPTAGYAEVALGATVTLNPGDWLAISADNTTATFYGLNGLTSALYAGVTYSKTTEHPIATASPTVVAESNRNIALIGVA